MFRSMLKSLQNLFNSKQKPPVELGPAYEYCPRCDANLTLQKGYDHNLSYWKCLGCGEMLINPELDADSNIIWFCDGCDAVLNNQQGFNEECGDWKCTECGYVNKIDLSELYRTDDEYQEELRNPYRGLTDEEVLELSAYQDEEYIDDRDDIAIVTNRNTGERFIRKLLTTYEKSIYDHIKDHPIANMPRIEALYESSNCLIVIESYIEGRTVADMIKNGPISENEAIRVAKGVCRVLEQLHGQTIPIVHRDIKPANIIVTPDDEIYLLDMNVAKWYDPDKTDDTRYMGTQYYAAPEQVGYGLSASSAKADIYAVGMLLNVMLTGCFPKEKKAEGRLWNIIECCIELNAIDRYTAGELLAELEKLG